MLLTRDRLATQVAGRLVRLAQSASTHFNKPVVTRQYVRVLLGRYDVELEQLSSTRTIQVKVHAENATGLLQQVEFRCLAAVVGGLIC